MTILPVNPDAIPAELKALPQWVVWKLEERNGKPTKPPYDAKTGRLAKTNDPSTWSDFETALNAYRNGNGYAGIGLALQKGDGLVGLDIDHVIDPATGIVDPRALEILERFKGTYTERSPSGTGFRLFPHGQLQGLQRPGKNEGKVKWLEVYDHTSARYLSTTGQHWQGTATTVTEQQAALDWLQAKYFSKPLPTPTQRTAPPVGAAISLDDAALLDKALAASNGAKFRALWSGDRTGYSSVSEADLALCSLLAFWTGKDAGRIDRLFRQSGLKRDKWDSRRGDGTYGQMTINKAIADCQEVYTGGGKPKGTEPPERELPPLEAYKDTAPGSKTRTHLKNAARSEREDTANEGNGADTEPPEQELPPAEAYEDTVPGKPIIDALPGDLHIVVRKAEQALLAADVAIFQRVGALVRPATLTTEVQIAGTTLPAGTLVIEPANKAWLTEKFNQIATWRKYNERRKGMVKADCPAKYAEHYLAKKGEWNVKVLIGIVEAPTLRRDGSLLTQPGYDPLSGLYLNYTGQPVTVPENPTREDALAALEVLKEPFAEFPFVSEVDRSVILSGLLTAITRRVLKSAPYHGTDAPEAGSGKGLLVDSCALVATGRTATTTTLGVDETETEKRLGALLMRGVSVISLDNAVRPVDGDFLCALATQETIEPRVLGKSETVTVSSNTATIFITGNNLTFKGDMTRRVLICRIDPRCERPDARQFKRDLKQFVTDNRHHLISAALTILRAYGCAGRPPHGKAPYGSFEQWDSLVRGALLWLEQPDPLDSRERIVTNDPQRQQLVDLLTAWYSVFKDQRVTTSQVIQAARVEVVGGKETYSTPDGEALRQALLAVAGQGETINPRIFGRYLAKNLERTVDGHRLEQVGTRSDRVLWQVRTVTTVRTVSTTQSSFFRSEERSIEKESAKNIAVAGTNRSNRSNRSDCGNCIPLPPVEAAKAPPPDPGAAVTAVTPVTAVTAVTAVTPVTAVTAEAPPPDPADDDGYLEALLTEESPPSSRATPEPERPDWPSLFATATAAVAGEPPPPEPTFKRFVFILKFCGKKQYEPYEPITLAMATSAGQKIYGEDLLRVEVQA